VGRSATTANGEGALDAEDDLHRDRRGAPVMNGAPRPTGARLRAMLPTGVACLCIWIAAVAGSLVVAAETTVGPVVVDLSHNHGIHLGDLLIVALATLAATAASVVLVARRWASWAPRTPPDRDGADQATGTVS
jgi:hypothetical protein